MKWQPYHAASVYHVLAAYLEWFDFGTGYMKWGQNKLSTLYLTSLSGDIEQELNKTFIINGIAIIDLLHHLGFIQNVEYPGKINNIHSTQTLILVLLLSIAANLFFFIIIILL